MKYGLRDYGVTLSDRELDIVLNAFDKNKDGRIDFDEFLRGVRVRGRVPAASCCLRVADASVLCRATSARAAVR